MLFTRRGLLLWHTPRYARRNAPHHAGRLPSRDVGRAAVRRGRSRVARADASRGTGRQRAGVAAVAAVPRRRLVDQPATRGRPAGVVRRATDVPARLGPANVALLRSAGQRGGELAAARQFSGSPDTRGRLAHLADQHRHGLAGQSGGARFRLPLRRPTARPHGQNPHHDGTTRTLPGPFLQLVRHAHAQTAAPALRVERRQRQSRRGAVHLAGRAAGIERPAHRFAARSDRAAATPWKCCRSAGNRPAPRKAASVRRRPTSPRPSLALAPGTQPRRRRRCPPTATRNSNGGRSALVRQCHAALDDLQFLVPDPQRFDHVPTLQELAGASTGGRPRRRAHPADRPTRPALHRAGGDGLRLPVRSRPRFVVDRLQRQRPPPRSVVLRPARLGGAAGEFHAHRPGPVAAGPLVRPGPAVDHPRRRDGVVVVERLDVRVPDAAAGDADLRAHAARRDLPGRRRPPDRIRPPARRALGHFRVVLQRHRRPRRLSVQRVRRAGLGVQARSGRRSGRRAVRVGAGVDGRAPGGLPESGSAGGRRLPRRVRAL